MPKKTATTRGGAQRNKPRVKVQKSFELVRQVSDEPAQEPEQEQEPEAVSSAEPTAVSVSTLAALEIKENKSKSAAALITAEHYAYVRKDLVFIAILAVIMFSAIIILHFVPGIGS